MKALILSFSLVLLLCISLVAAAPLPHQNPSCIMTSSSNKLARRNGHLSSLVERSSYHNDLWDREIKENSLFTRDEEIRLVRRVSVGAKIKHAFQEFGHDVKKGFQTAAKKVAEGLKTAAKKVGHFAKEVGAKVAKFGLEVVSTAQSVAAKAAKFIPGIGKPISAALTGMSKATSVASDKIHANLGSKLQKGMDVMKKIQNPVGGVAGKALNALRRGLV